MTELKEGSLAPEFSLPSVEGTLSSKDFINKKKIVLYFYPKDHTPGCTEEACDFRDRYKKILAEDAVLLAVSADSTASHQKFREKYGLPFSLLSDEDKRTLKKFGVWKEKSLYGRKFMGIERTTFLIDKKGRIRKIFPKVKVKGHAEEVLEALKQL